MLHWVTSTGQCSRIMELYRDKMEYKNEREVEETGNRNMTKGDQKGPSHVEMLYPKE